MSVLRYGSPSVILRWSYGNVLLILRKWVGEEILKFCQFFYLGTLLIFVRKKFASPLFPSPIPPDKSR